MMSTGAKLDKIPNFTFKELKIGSNFESRFKISGELISNFANLTGDNHPIHVDENFIIKNNYPDLVAHGLLISSLASSIIATKLIGANMLLINQSFNYIKPIYKNQMVTIRVDLKKKDIRFKTIYIEANIHNDDEITFAEGNFLIMVKK